MRVAKMMQRLAEFERCIEANKVSFKQIIDVKDTRIKELEAALGQLIACKTHKDAYGKDEAYEQQQPLAWEQARKVMGLGIEPVKPEGGDYESF